MTLSELELDPSYVRYTDPRPPIPAWSAIASRVIAGDFNRSNPSTKTALIIGLRNNNCPLSKQAAALLRASIEKS